MQRRSRVDLRRGAAAWGRAAVNPLHANPPGRPQAPSSPPPLIATKYAPQPWRFTADSVPAACRASLKRLQLDQMSLFIQHWPGFALNAFSNDAYLEGLARCYEQVTPGAALPLSAPRSSWAGLQ